MESVARIGTSASATGIRPASPFGEPGLAVGQTIHARVMRVEGDTVQLRWGDQSLSVASRVPLSVGQQVGEHFFFRVRQGFGDAQATELILEYQLEDHLRVQAAAAETPSAQRVTFRRVERAGLDLIFFFSY